MSAPLLQLRQVQFSYDTPQNAREYNRGFSLDCPHLSVEAGEALLIRGATGSGKSTLGKLMAGILKPCKGELLLHGAVANDYHLGRAGQTVGYLFQEPGRQLFCTTAEEELLFVSRFLGKDETAARSKAEALLQRFGLTHLRERSIYRLSLGEKQRLALAAVMIQEPRLLLLDEPTSGLDQAMRDDLCGLLEAMLDSGIAVALISHDSMVARRFGRRIVMVESGVVKC